MGEARLGLLGVIPLVPPRESPVPDDANAAERAGQHLLLHLIRVRPALVRHPHSNQAYLIALNQISTTHRRGEPRFLTGLKAGVSTPQL